MPAATITGRAKRLVGHVIHPGAFAEGVLDRILLRGGEPDGAKRRWRIEHEQEGRVV